MKYLALFLFFLIPQVQAYSGIFSILNETYVYNVTDLPRSNNNNITPDIQIQSSGAIEGWIDIIGWNNSAKINGSYYVENISNPIIMYDVWVDQNKLKSKIVSEDYFCYWCSVDSIEKSISINSSENTTAYLNIVMRWHETITNENSIQQFNYTDYATFIDTEVSPKIYTSQLLNNTVHLTQYNNSLYENIGIKILGDNYTKASFRYQNKSAVRTLRVLHAENNSKGVIFGNTTELEQWKIEGTGISRFYNEILLDGNLSQMDINEFDIQICDAFTCMKVNPANFIIQRVEFAPYKAFNGLFLGVVGVVSTLILGTLYLSRRLIKWNLNLF